LHHLHEHGIVHRDLKPRNAMLTTDGKVKLLDFGLVRLWAEATSSDQLTSSGTWGRLGTPQYMAPEQWTDPHGVTRTADVYSLGCTLCFLLTGLHPFHRFGRHQQEHAHLHETIPDVDALTDVSLPNGLADVVKRMLQKSPANRYPTAADAADALAPHCIDADLARYGDDVKDAMQRRPAPEIFDWELDALHQMGSSAEPSRQTEIEAETAATAIVGNPSSMRGNRVRYLFSPPLIAVWLVVCAVGVWAIDRYSHRPCAVRNMSSRRERRRC
jgi:serine/threonine protein kinase